MRRDAHHKTAIRVLTIPDATLCGKVARSPAKRVTEEELCLALRWKENERKVNSLVRHSPKQGTSVGEKSPLHVRREKALDFSGRNSRPGTGSLHPVATETTAEVTKRSELSV